MRNRLYVFPSLCFCLIISPSQPTLLLKVCLSLRSLCFALSLPSSPSSIFLPLFSLCLCLSLFSLSLPVSVLVSLSLSLHLSVSVSLSLSLFIFHFSFYLFIKMMIERRAYNPVESILQFRRIVEVMARVPGTLNVQNVAMHMCSHQMIQILDVDMVSSN